MTAVDNLAAWLEQVWADDKAHAEKDIHLADQAGGDWAAHYGHNVPYSFLARDGQGFAEVTSDSHSADVMLMARFKPSTVYARAEQTLARIEADRQILAVHDVAWNVEVCTVCHRTDDGGDTLEQEPWPCPTVRLLAVRHADRPGYREEWRP